MKSLCLTIQSEGRLTRRLRDRECAGLDYISCNSAHIFLRQHGYTCLSLLLYAFWCILPARQNCKGKPFYINRTHKWGFCSWEEGISIQAANLEWEQLCWTWALARRVQSDPRAKSREEQDGPGQHSEGKKFHAFPASEVILDSLLRSQGQRVPAATPSCLEFYNVTSREQALKSARKLYFKKSTLPIFFSRMCVFLMISKCEESANQAAKLAEGGGFSINHPSAELTYPTVHIWKIPCPLYSSPNTEPKASTVHFLGSAHLICHHTLQLLPAGSLMPKSPLLWNKAFHFTSGAETYSANTPQRGGAALNSYHVT